MMLREPWRTRLLFLSVALNLFLAALIGSKVLIKPPHFPPNTQALVDRMAHDMPADDATRFRAVMAEARQENDAAHERMEAARRAMSRAIGRTPYDEAAVREAMHTWQASWIDFSNSLGASMLKALAGLSPDGRRRLAEAGQRRPSP